MKIKKYSTYIAKQEYSVELKFANLTPMEINALLVLFPTYSNVVKEAVLGTTDLFDQGYLVPDFMFMFSVKQVQNIKNLKQSQVVASFYAKYLDVEDEVRTNKFIELITEIFKFSNLDANNEEVKNAIDTAKLFTGFITPEMRLEKSILKDKYFDGQDDYLFGTESPKWLHALENFSSYEEIVDLFNSAKNKLLSNIIELDLFVNANNSKNDEIIELISNSFKVNENLSEEDQFKVKTTIKDIESKYVLNKTTANSYVFYEIEHCDDIKQYNVTKDYFNELFLSFYMNTIRLEHNLIYSPRLVESDSISHTRHEVQQANIEKLVALEDKFFAECNNSINEDIFEQLKIKLRNKLENYYEDNMLKSINTLAHSLGINADFDDIEKLYAEVENVINSLNSNIVDLSKFKCLGRTTIVGE